MRLIRLMILSTILVLFSHSHGQTDEQEEAVFFELKPSIIVNLNKGAAYARCDIQLMTRGKEQVRALELHAPALRNEFLLLIPEFDGVSLRTPEGKEDLRSKALEATQEILENLTGQPVVEGLYFTAFYVE